MNHAAPANGTFNPTVPTRCQLRGKPTNGVPEAARPDFARNKAVQQSSVVRTAAGQFQRGVSPNSEDGDGNPVTTCKTIRDGASLDRLALSMRENFGIAPTTAPLLQHLEN